MGYMKRIALFLATQKGFAVLENLINSSYKENIACVISFHEVGVQKDYCSDLELACKTSGIPFFLWKDVKESLEKTLKNFNTTNIIAISWRYLLPLNLNEFLEDDIIVFHDSLLPKYRGFAPVVTAILCGDTTIGATALFATDSVDAGDIILQKPLEVTQDDYIENVIERMSNLYVSMALELIANICKGNLKAIPQNESLATYSVWRDEEDYKIDWKKNSMSIFNQIRATGFPYKGSYSIIDGEKIRIVEVCLESEVNFALRDFGKIWKIENGQAIVVCGEGMIRIKKAVYEDGKVYQFKNIRKRFLV